MHSVWEIQRHRQENGATVGLADAVRSFNSQILHDSSAIRRLLSHSDRGLWTLAVSIATPVVVDNTKPAGERRLDEHRSAFVTHAAMHKHDRLPRSLVQEFQCHTIDFGLLHLWPGHVSTSGVRPVHCSRKLSADGDSSS